MAVITILIGLPGSGKSTFAKELKDGLETEGLSSPVIVSTDEFVKRIAKDLNSTYDAEFKKFYPMAETLFWQHVSESVRDRRDIIVDRTNLTKKARAKIINKLIELDALDDYDVTSIEFRPHLETCLKRVALREDQSVPEEVILMMEKQYQPVNIEEELIDYGLVATEEKEEVEIKE